MTNPATSQPVSSANGASSTASGQSSAGKASPANTGITPSVLGGAVAGVAVGLLLAFAILLYFLRRRGWIVNKRAAPGEYGPVTQGGPIEATDVGMHEIKRSHVHQLDDTMIRSQLDERGHVFQLAGREQER